MSTFLLADTLNLPQMSKVLRIRFVLVILLWSWQHDAFPKDPGKISGTLLLDDTWERKVFLSLVESFEKEFTFSNSFILATTELDSLGNFEIPLENVSTDWSMLRLHVVKKGFAPKYLVIGSNEENYVLIIAKRDSEIRLFNTEGMPVFENKVIEGAPYMETFDYISRLAEYPNAIDYESSLVEKEFIEDVVAEKLKAVADTSSNPLVSLYALYKTDFLSDYQKDPDFYKAYLAKMKNESDSYFDPFRRQFPISNSFPWILVLTITLVGTLFLVGLYISHKRKPKLGKLSVQERRILDLLQQGMSNQEISDACNIELSTTKSHVGSIYSKLKIKSRKQALDIKIK
ncbi:MAG: helix-turn-helix domain-containing protein [Cyclobacteriaceae bacterium]